VTFRQTDPLYVVDLADPAAPAVRGELKIPGYSAYLHPLGDGLVLGVGQDATDQGTTTGVQVSTFDLRDPTAPTRVDVLVEPRTWSDVEADSRQFTYLPSRRTALLPVSGERGWALHSYAVDGAGRLSATGTWGQGTAAWGQRALPLDDDRAAVLAQEEAGPAVHVVAVDGLVPLGAARLW